MCVRMRVRVYASVCVSMDVNANGRVGVRETKLCIC